MVAGALLPNAVLISSCNDGKGENTSKVGGLTSKSIKAAKSADWENKSAGINFVDRLNIATLRQKGIFIDFGTTDYFKYTLGKWRTGWGNNFIKEGVSFTQAKGPTGRIYFPWYEDADAVLKIRLAAKKAKLVSVYINNKPLSKIDFNNKGWTSHTLKISKSMLHGGDNYLLLRWQGSGTITTKDDAAWVDYVHVQEGGESSENIQLPTQKSVAAKVEIGGGGGQVQALNLYPGFTLSYYVQVPDGNLEPELGFYMKPQNTEAKAGGAQQTAGAGGGKLVLTAHMDKNQDVPLLEEDVSPDKIKNFEPRSIDLLGLANRIIRLDISYRGAAVSGNRCRIVLAKPAVYVSGKNFKQAPAIIRGKNRKIARNAIIIMIDTLRADHTRCYGAQNIKTPVLDRLAEEGAMFERFSAVEDWTKPSCATMLTGLYPNTHKAQTESAVLSSSVKMVSEELKNRGFTTGAFIANGYVSGKFGFKRGWDYYENYIREKKPTEAENVFNKSADWINKVRDKRFFAYIHTIDPHVPYAPPDDFIKLYDSKPYSGPIKPRMSHIQLEEIKKGNLKVSERDKQRVLALYKGEISYHDKYLGSFMQKMADLGLLEDTLLIITADHGEEFWEHGSVGHGHSIFQELVHVPFILFWKGTLPTGNKIADNHDHGVIVSTMFDAMGLDFPDYLEGASILPKAMGQDETYPHAGFSTHQGERMGVWSGNMKLQMNGPLKTYLYDMDKDPACKNNVYKNHPTALRYMRSLLGMFMGAPDKRDWKSTRLLAEKKLDVKVEEVEWDDELKQQLQKLGYINK